MANIELLILITLSLGLLSYVLYHFSPRLSSALTILGSFFVFGSVLYHGYIGSFDVSSTLLPYVSFSSSALSIFFAVIITFTYAMVSLFNPYFLKTHKAGNVHNLLFLSTLAFVLGVLFTNHFMTMFFFFEAVVWTSLFMIPLKGSKSAAIMYYGFSAFGSFALLGAIFFLKANSGTFLITESLAVVDGAHQLVIFILLVVAGMAKLGAFPFHIWLPEVLGKAPDHTSALFSGGLEKLGAFIIVFALVRVAPVGATFAAIDLAWSRYAVAILGALTIVFGTLMAIRQDDAKKLLAYSSMSNGGYMLVAFSLMNSISVMGGLYHVLAHALASVAAFLAIAAVARQTNTTKMSELGGMIHKMPITYMVYLIAIISMAGIPPMGGFISKWLIFQAVINKGLIFVAVAVFFGSVGSFLYVFRPLAALFLGQELPQYKKTLKEAPSLMLLAMLILSVLNIFTGVFPTPILKVINTVIVEMGMNEVVLTTFTIEGFNGLLHPGLIALVFMVGVFVAFVIFISLKKSKKVGLMDTYTAGNFIYTEELMHYSVDFYAPLERLYEKYIDIARNVYRSLDHKIKEFARLIKYFIFTYKPEITAFWVVLILILFLWGDIA
ncbi:MAG: proton-conducting transporter transmembrane domain-containing protein [Candidatus Izemoplasmataceae bacterium]